MHRRPRSGAPAPAALLQLHCARAAPVRAPRAPRSKTKNPLTWQCLVLQQGTTARGLVGALIGRRKRPLAYQALAEQEIVLRMRTAARDMRRGVLARRLHGPPPRIGYERRVWIRLAGLTPPRRSRVRAAAAVAAANSGPIGTSTINLGEGGHCTGADDSPALSLPPRLAD